jgi:hypothetical protein
VLGKTESQIRWLVKAGVLRWVGVNHRIDPASVEALFAENDDAFRAEALDELLRASSPHHGLNGDGRHRAPIFPYLLPCRVLPRAGLSVLRRPCPPWD